MPGISSKLPHWLLLNIALNPDGNIPSYISDCNIVAAVNTPYWAFIIVYHHMCGPEKLGLGVGD